VILRQNSLELAKKRRGYLPATPRERRGEKKSNKNLCLCITYGWKKQRSLCLQILIVGVGVGENEGPAITDASITRSRKKKKRPADRCPFPSFRCEERGEIVFQYRLLPAQGQKEKKKKRYSSGQASERFLFQEEKNRRIACGFYPSVCAVERGEG